MDDLYTEYEALSRDYPGWSLTELKEMPVRERRHWVSVLLWRREQQHG